MHTQSKTQQSLFHSKYPKISCMEEREKYRAIFNDQYLEYKDLHRDVSSTLSKFSELDAAMERLLSEGKSHQVRRISKQSPTS